MELGRQIKKHRSVKGYSQEELANRIYVSRQTISNWETDRTYPDIQSLLLLSTLFGVTLDDLVKGDVETMKKTIDANRINTLSWVMLIGIVITAFLILPCLKYWGLIGLILPLALYAVTLVAAVIVERLKSNNNVRTYSEIVAFLEGTPRDEERIAHEREHFTLKKLLMALACGAVALAIAAISFLIFYILMPS
ncbi:MAG: helix-turn-helix domain-containing protein [Coriobacteriales bacterium]|jgi:transcriptional regulator with XRE-family HTH domain|nr:helix-turn-helix domain-containing protein [Coriobacteriales bacterium]